MARQVVLKAMSETPVLVTSSSSGLMTIEGHPNVAKRRVALTASGIIEVVPRQPLHILAANFGEKTTSLPKHMLVGVGEEPPQCVVHFQVDEIIDPASESDALEGGAKGTHFDENGESQRNSKDNPQRDEIMDSVNAVH